MNLYDKRYSTMKYRLTPSKILILSASYHKQTFDSIQDVNLQANTQIMD